MASPQHSFAYCSVLGTQAEIAQTLDLVAAGKSCNEITSGYFPDLYGGRHPGYLELARDQVENEDIHVVEELPRL